MPCAYCRFDFQFCLGELSLIIPESANTSINQEKSSVIFSYQIFSLVSNAKYDQALLCLGNCFSLSGVISMNLLRFMKKNMKKKKKGEKEARKKTKAERKKEMSL